MYVPIYIVLGVLAVAYASAWPAATRCEDVGGRAVIGAHMAHSFYKLPDDNEEVIRIALALRPEQILMGEVNPVSLCRRLVAQIRALQYQAKNKPMPFPERGVDPLESAP